MEIQNAVGVRVRELPLSGERVLSALQGESSEIRLDLDVLKKSEGI